MIVALATPGREASVWSPQGVGIRIPTTRQGGRPRRAVGCSLRRKQSMVAMRQFLHSLRFRLLASFVGIGIGSIVIVGALAFMDGRARLAQLAGEALQQHARGAIDKIDRNLFERYGDVQAFAYHPKARGCRRGGAGMQLLHAVLWHLRPDDRSSPISTVRCSPVTPSIPPVSRSTPPRCSAGASLASLGSKRSAVASWRRVNDFADPTEDACNLQVHGTPRRSLNFSAPALDQDGKVVRVWSNRASWSEPPARSGRAPAGAGGPRRSGLLHTGDSAQWGPAARHGDAGQRAPAQSPSRRTGVGPSRLCGLRPATAWSRRSPATTCTASALRHRRARWALPATAGLRWSRAVATMRSPAWTSSPT